MFLQNLQASGLGYHCEYHPDIMNGTITVFAIIRKLNLFL